jgi:hypothetical protein
MEMGNPIGVMKPSHHEHTEILDLISFHLDGHSRGKCCKRIMLPLTDRQHFGSGLDLEIKL